MSLLLDSDNKPRPTLTALWKAAHSKEAGEPEALSFWQHLLAKHEFKEEHWIIDAEIRPEPHSRSRIDRGIRFLTTGNEIIVLCWIEGKGDDSRTATKECEEQARLACQRNLASHPWQKTIFAFTTLVTKGKAWIYDVDHRVLNPMHDEDYIEANSSEGVQLRKCFVRMKSFPPAAPAGAPNSNVGSQPHFGQITSIASLSPGQVLASDRPQTYSNPIFPREEAPVFPPPETSAISRQNHGEGTRSATDGLQGFREVVVMRDPRDQNRLLYKVEGGWKAMGTVQQGKKGDRIVVYSWEQKIWSYVDKLPKRS